MVEVFCSIKEFRAMVVPFAREMFHEKVNWVSVETHQVLVVVGFGDLAKIPVRNVGDHEVPVNAPQCMRSTQCVRQLREVSNVALVFVRALDDDVAAGASRNDGSSQ